VYLFRCCWFCLNIQHLHRYFVCHVENMMEQTNKQQYSTIFYLQTNTKFQSTKQTPDGRHRRRHPTTTIIIPRYCHRHYQTYTLHTAKYSAPKSPNVLICHIYLSYIGTLYKVHTDLKHGKLVKAVQSIT
jgi:hypothetical protein